jgi:hypothetical protein
MFVSSSYAYDITDKFSIGGVLSGTYQFQWVDGDDNKGRGAVPFQPEFSFRPTERMKFSLVSVLQPATASTEFLISIWRPGPPIWKMTSRTSTAASGTTC